VRIGDCIKKIREQEKGFKRSYLAKELGISARAYANIENNITDITLNRLESIARIFECNILYILNYSKITISFNGEANNGCGDHISAEGQCYVECPKIEALLRELLQCERARIKLLERLLREHSIEF